MSSGFIVGLWAGLIFSLVLIMFPLGILVYLYGIKLIKDAWRNLR